MTLHHSVKTLTFGPSSQFRHFDIDGTPWFEAGEITRILFPNDQAFGSGFYEKMSADQIISVKMRGDSVETLSEPVKNMRKLLSEAGIRFLIERSRAAIARHKRPQLADPERNWEFELWIDEYLASLPKPEPKPEPEPEPEMLPAVMPVALVVSRLSVDIEHPIGDRKDLLIAWDMLVQRTFKQGVEIKGIAVQYLEADQAA